MNQKTFIALGGCAPLLVCTVLPFVIFGTLFGQWGTNLVWGLVFGFGWWAAQSTGGPEHWRAAAAVGGLVWIPMVVIGLFFLSRFIWRSGNDRTRKVFLLLLVISCLPMVPAKTVMSTYSNARVPPDLSLLMASSY